jgi:hypothetical protein
MGKRTRRILGCLPDRRFTFRTGSLFRPDIISVSSRIPGWISQWPSDSGEHRNADAGQTVDSALRLCADLSDQEFGAEKSDHGHHANRRQTEVLTEGHTVSNGPDVKRKKRVQLDWMSSAPQAQRVAATDGVSASPAGTAPSQPPRNTGPPHPAGRYRTKPRRPASSGCRR